MGLIIPPNGDEHPSHTLKNEKKGVDLLRQLQEDPTIINTSMKPAPSKKLIQPSLFFQAVKSISHLAVLWVTYSVRRLVSH